MRGPAPGPRSGVGPLPGRAAGSPGLTWAILTVYISFNPLSKSSVFQLHNEDKYTFKKLTVISVIWIRFDLEDRYNASLVI